MALPTELAQTIIDPKAYSQREIVDAAFAKIRAEQPLDKAEVASWNARIEGECFMAIAEAMRNSAPAMKDRALPGPDNYAQIPELAERGRARLADFLARFEAHLTGREWVAGGAFSVADITAAVALDFARVLRIDASEGRPAIAAWRERIATRPAFSL